MKYISVSISWSCPSSQTSAGSPLLKQWQDCRLSLCADHTSDRPAAGAVLSKASGQGGYGYARSAPATADAAPDAAGHQTLRTPWRGPNSKRGRCSKRGPNSLRIPLRLLLILIILPRPLLFLLLQTHIFTYISVAVNATIRKPHWRKAYHLPIKKL